MTGLSVLEAIDEAFARVSDRRAGLGFAAVFLTQLLMLVGIQSQVEAQRDELADEELPFGADLEMLPGQLPLALEIPLGVSTLLWLTMLVGFVTASVVAFRLLVRPDSGASGIDSDDLSHDASATDARSWDTESETTTSSEEPHSSVTSTTVTEAPPDTEERSASRPAWNEALARTTLSAFAAAVLGSMLVSLGLALLVVPGLVVATAFAFTHPYLATERVGVIEAMKRSLELVRGSWIKVFALLVVIVMSFITISSLGAFAVAALQAYPLAGELANVALTALAWLFALAILASGFDQLEHAQAQEDARWEGIDDELLP
ncbi:hypothetical protein ACLI4Q_18175 [Natrialbaceae archaeon A-CW1-1]